MKSKNIITLATLAAVVGLAGFATTGCNLDVASSLVGVDSIGRAPGLDDETGTRTPGTNVVPLGDSSLGLEGPEGR